MRDLSAGDAAAVRALVTSGGVPAAYRERLRELGERALRGADECRGVALETATGGAPHCVGLALFGLVPGTVRTGAILGLYLAPDARGHGDGRRLVDAAVARLADRGARFTVVEVPDDPALAGVRRVLARCGFAEEARVPDLVRDGVALVILRRPGEPGSPGAAGGPRGTGATA